MGKRLLSLILVIVMITSVGVTAYAHSKEGADGHDEFLSDILFGSKSYKDTLKDGSEAFKALEALEDAIALCIDQYQGNYEDELKSLNKLGVHGLPKSIDAIDFTSNQHHRRYTHQGWNHSYVRGPSSWDSDTKGPWNGNWETRKTILLQTINKVFGFQKRAGKWKMFWFEKDYGYDEQCQAFAEFVYYVHILADIPDSGMDEGFSDMIKLALANPTKDSPDIYTEMLRILPVLFESQKDSNAYSGLISDIKLQAESARAYIRKTPDLRSNYSEYQKYASNLLQKLESKIPGLLEEEEFFKAVFYSSK